jgi:hypothetical protein
MHGLGSLRDIKAKDERTEHSGFKAFDHQYLHINVKYLAQKANETLRGYRFVAFQRVIRWNFVSIYRNKTATDARCFFRKLEDIYPTGVCSNLIDTDKPFIDRFSAYESANITSLTRFAQRLALNTDWLYKPIEWSSGSTGAFTRDFCINPIFMKFHNFTQ